MKFSLLAFAIFSATVFTLGTHASDSFLTAQETHPARIDDTNKNVSQVTGLIGTFQ